MFPVIEIFGRSIGVYALCSFLGLGACTYGATKLGKKYNFLFEDLILVVLAIVLGLIVGGHILYALTNTENIVFLFKNINTLNIKNTFHTLSKIFGGMVFYGGFIGALISLKIYTKLAQIQNSGALLDIFGICVPLFHTFGRIGCFFGGCCYGIESRFGFIITNNHLVPLLNGVRRLPISLIEAFFNLVIFLILLFLFKRQHLKCKLVYAYMLMYSPLRFCTEFFRGDDIRGFWGPLSTSQWVSIVLFVWGSAVFIRQKKTTRCMDKKLNIH